MQNPNPKYKSERLVYIALVVAPIHRLANPHQQTVAAVLQSMLDMQAGSSSRFMYIIAPNVKVNARTAGQMNCSAVIRSVASIWFYIIFLVFKSILHSSIEKLKRKKR